MMALAGTDVVFTVAALDRNPDDVVEIMMIDAPDLHNMSLVVGPNVHDERLLVTGLEKTSRNRVSRQVRWAVPNDGISHTVCFRARDNQFPCSDGGLESEEKFCVHCNLDSLGVYTTCSSTLVVEKLDERLAPIMCGDARITDVEECDDGNVKSGDGCSSLCKLEEGYYQDPALSLSPEPEYVCGDGLVVIGETCDDNNTVAGDGCDSICRTEQGFTCLECAGLTECLPTCGDGLMKSNHLRTEACDGVEGCSSECSIEEGWHGTGNVLNPICGDGLLRGDESCDDANTQSGDGCSDTCQIEDNWNCGAAGCQAICGDGVRAGLEECDDGNLLAGDGCSRVCRIETFFFCQFGDFIGNGTTRYPDVCAERCGDGERVQSNRSRVRPGFDRINACDDGNSAIYDGCSADCKIEADLGWECADDTSALGTVASPRSVCGPKCGDGMRTENEECDDGNLLNRDGCSSTCKIETGFVCTLGTAGAQAQMRMETSSCINTLQANGTCCFSHGNLSYGALCSPTTHPGNAGAYCLSKSDLCVSSLCEPTIGKSQEICYLLFTGRASPESVLMNMHDVSYLERGVADACSSSCGDGHRALQEECDDANLVSSDGCSSTCKIEAGWYCLHQPGPQGDFCSSICGDAVLVPAVEECDDGAWTEATGDGCTSQCKLEVGFNCSYDDKNRLYGGRCNPVCGDGWWVLGEGCDDGNQNSLDGCSSDCLVEPGWVCGADALKPVMRTSVCVGFCGDGIKVSGEECDDNNILNGDGCTEACEIEPGFACLDTSECYTVCGDGVVYGKESCDDANTVNGDGCSDDCVIEHGYQCIQAVCPDPIPPSPRAGAVCQVQSGGLGSYCQECPPVRQTAVRCSNPPCPVVGLTADCEQWLFTGDGAWVRKEDLPVSSFSMLCKPEWYGDGFCDALNNREECEYDKGDCCQRSCACGGANTNMCYNGIMGGCGKYQGKKGDFRCIQSVSETGENLAADVAVVRLSGGNNTGADMYGPYLSWVQVEIVPPGPGLDIYVSTDGKPPAEETATRLVIHGTPYVKPFNVTSNQLVRVSTVKWGLAVGQVSLPLTIQVEKPTISPSPEADQVLSSPVLVSISTETPGATIVYKLAGQASDEPFVYLSPFAVDSGGAVTAWAEKEGLVSSEMTSTSYTLKTTTPTIVPAPGGYVGQVEVNVSTGTSQATVYVTVCNGTKYPGWSNQSIGKIRQTNKDVYCFPNCKGACVGGYNDKKACASIYDLSTCGGGGACVESEHEVRECFPTEWPPGRFIWSAPIIINQTDYGSGAWVTSYATREGMADSDLTSQQYNITTAQADIHILPDVYPSFLPWPKATPEIITIPFAEHGQDEGPYPSPLLFNFSNPSPADIFYTLDKSTPMPGSPGTFRVPYAVPQPPLRLNFTATITWVAIAKTLEPSIVQRRSVAVQAVAPELMVDVNFFDKADGLSTVWEWRYIAPSFVEEEKPQERSGPGKGLVTKGFAYPGIGKVELAEPGRDHDLFKVVWPRLTGLPLISMRGWTQDAHMYYRLVYNGSLVGWPKTAVRPGSSEPDSLEELSAKGWVRFAKDDKPKAIDRNVTVEVMTAVPGSTLIKSDVKSYPLMVREKCMDGRASLDGYGPCDLCPLDSYMVCRGRDSLGIPTSPCTCAECKMLGNDTGTYRTGSSGPESCKPFCPVGAFNPLAGIDVNMTNCTKCGLGSYTNATRSSACTVCPVGTSTWRYGGDDILLCRGAGGLDAGGFHTCGVDVNGGAKCWGYNGFNQTSVPKKLVKWDENGVPYAEERDDTWYAVAAGSFHSCGITTEMKAKCWGQDFAGKTTVPTMHLYHSPEMPLRNVIEWQSMSASAGYHHTCGIADGRALCWGDNEYEQTNVPAGRYWRSISAGQFHSCGIDSNATAHCWGDNSYGQSQVPAEETKWRNVSAGHYHSCGVTAVGKLLCWGSTLYEATSFPLDVDAWSSVAVGRFHSCGVTVKGQMRCWGSNQDGAVSVPDGISSWRAVTTGLFHTCGITHDRTGVCWGRSLYGLHIVPDAAWSSV
jgi:cysteine-rich repeat protein